MPRQASRPSLVLLAAVLAGCGANMAPVLDVQNAPVVAAHGVTPTRALVRDAIVRALVSRTWQIVSERDEAIEASVTAGGHSATALIQYDDRSYSITRISSTPGLKYDGQRIHKRYNHWIDRLRASINQELGNTGAAAAGPAEPMPAAADGTAPPPPPAADDLPPAPPPPPAAPGSPAAPAPGATVD